jgi:hypothetical protein
MSEGKEEPGPPWERDVPGKLEIFVNIWKGFQGTELSGAQDFLRRLLEIYDVSSPPGTIFEQHPVSIPVRPKATSQATLFATEEKPRYTTERIDMYLPRVCIWEMKSPTEKDLTKHHDQLLRYWARTRTRYMVLCNFREFWIYDTDDDDGQLAPKIMFPLAELPARWEALRFLRGEEADLERRSERITADVARLLGQLVREMLDASPDREADRPRITKLVLEHVFAMFAEDTELVPPMLFTSVMQEAEKDGKMDAVWSLFDDFGRKDPRDRANRFAPYINGPLFDRNFPKLPLTRGQIHVLYRAAKEFDWQAVRPEIFGSIFEQALHLEERHELGAHFTREADIAKVVGPTVTEPWRARIRGIRTVKDAERVVEEMKGFHVLDPACGCGNFLYIVYREMKRLESALAKKWTEVHRFKAKKRSDIRPPPPLPYFTITQVHGMEKSPFGAYLARVVLWIGEHLAARELGLTDETLPLKNLDETIEIGDALLLDWFRPDGELAIVGNPPYLGVHGKMRRMLGDTYVDELFQRYPQNRGGDYVTYWFTRSLATLRPGERAGFVSTNSITQNESREVSIDQIIEKGGTITDAWTSSPWLGDAAVHVVVVNWVMAPYDGMKMLDGHEAMSISPGLTEAVDVTSARHIAANEELCFMGFTPGNTRRPARDDEPAREGFVLTAEQRTEIIASDPLSEKVIRPFLIGRDVNREIDQQPTRWIIDFAMMTKEEAEEYPGAMRHVRKHVYPIRKENRREAYAKNWWRFVEARPGLRDALQGTTRVLALPAVSPHLIVSYQKSSTCFDHQLMVVTLSDYFHFGILQSRIHEIWARARGSTLKGDLRYTNTTIFETFPFPTSRTRYDPRIRPLSEKHDRVAGTAAEFDRLRSATCKERGLGLTKIHNELTAGELPELGRAYDAMNDAVAACYGFPKGVWRDDREVLRRLLEANGRVAGPASSPE